MGQINDPWFDPHCRHSSLLIVTRFWTIMCEFSPLSVAKGRDFPLGAGVHRMNDRWIGWVRDDSSPAFCNEFSDFPKRALDTFNDSTHFQPWACKKAA